MPYHAEAPSECSVCGDQFVPHSEDDTVCQQCRKVGADKPQPSPGALRAAERICGYSAWLPSDVRECAAIIDAETGAAELAKALEMVARWMSGYGTATGRDMHIMVDTALARYRGQEGGADETR